MQLKFAGPPVGTIAEAGCGRDLRQSIIVQNLEGSDNRVVVQFVTKAAFSTLRLYDLRGNRVASREFRGAGTHRFDLNSAPGMYVASLSDDNETTTKLITARR
jgi:hypothetical protein